MGKIYTSVRGKEVDMEKLSIRNETEIAVGNAKLNARGDEIGVGGKIVRTREQILKDYYNDLSSQRFNDILSFITAKKTFVDPKNFGGGLHQGKKNSFLDMHLDFNYHPLNKKWYRELNLLLYLNKDWKPEYKGHLKIKDLRTNEEASIEVPFNRMIIQQCAPYTLHGYDMTNFPEGKFRTSIATYAYQLHNRFMEKPRTTDWFPKEDASVVKKLLAKNYNFLVQTKNKFFGSATAKNQ
jgi:hypothetical protein